MIRVKDLRIIAIISLVLAVIGFILDLNERVPNMITNISETILMAALIYVVIAVFYFPTKFILNKLSKHKS